MNQRKPGSLGDECFLECYWLKRLFYFKLEPCQSTNRGTPSPPQLGKHFLENILIVLRSPPLPSLFWKRSTCSGNKPKDGGNVGRSSQVCSRFNPAAPDILHGVCSLKERTQGAEKHWKQRELPRWEGVHSSLGTPQWEQLWTQCWPGPAQRGGVSQRAKQVGGKHVRMIPHHIIH